MRAFYAAVFILLFTVSCKDTVNTDLPKYSLNLIIQNGEREKYTSARVDPIGNIHIEEITARHNELELIRLSDGFDRYLYNNFRNDRKSNRVVISVGNDSTEVLYDTQDLIPVILDSAHVDTVITGRNFFKAYQPYSLGWKSEGSSDYYTVSLEWQEYVDGLLVETDTSFFTTNTNAEISAKYALPRITLSINACKGPVPGENEYKESEVIPLNVRLCTIYKTNLEGIESCDIPFARPCY